MSQTDPTAMQKAASQTTQPTQTTQLGSTPLSTGLRSTIRTFISLQWAITRSNLRASVWSIIGIVLEVLLQIALMFGCWQFSAVMPRYGAQFAGIDLSAVDISNLQRVDAATQATMASAWGLMLAGIATLIAFGVLLFQLMVSGGGSTINPDQLAHFGIDDKRMHIGMYAAMLTGFPSMIGIIDILLVSSAWRYFNIPIMLVAMLCGVLTIMVWVAVCSMIVVVVSTFIRSNRSKAIYYLVVVSLFVLIAQIPNLVMSLSGYYADESATLASTSASFLSASALPIMMQVSAWLPFGAAMSVPAALLTGHYLAAIAKLAITVASIAIALWIMVWCARYTRLHAQSNRVTSVQGLGAFAHVPDSIVGAVMARVIVYWRRDPRQLLNTILMPLLFLVIFGAQSYGADEPMMIWMAPVFVAWILSLVESNNIALDGTAITFQILNAVPVHKDRLGRALTGGGLASIIVLLCSVVATIISKAWSDAFTMQIAVVVTCVALALVISSYSMAQLIAVLFPYPTASIDKPFASKQGKMGAQMFIPFLSMLINAVTLLPTGAVTAAVFIFELPLWIIAFAALIFGCAFGVLGVWLSGKVMKARELRIVQQVTQFASMD